MIIVGFDSEFVRRGETNGVLSYQYAVKTEDAIHTGIVYPKSEAVADRFTFSELLSAAIMSARYAKLIPDKWPSELYACAHFSRADFSTFRDYKLLANNLDALRGTYATLGSPLEMNLYDKSRNAHIGSGNPPRSLFSP